MIRDNGVARKGLGMDAEIRRWGGESVLLSYDDPTGSFMVIAIHSTRLGPAAGGTRLKTYPGAEDAVRDACDLAEAMTLKMAAARLPMGGGKSVLAVPRTDLPPEARRLLLHHHARNLEMLGGRYWTGPDMNTSSADMDVIRERTRYAFGASAAAGGSGSSAPDTAVGVFEGIRASLEATYGDPKLAGRRVLVQGCGAVGDPLVRMLHAEGASVVVSDVVFDRVEGLYDELDVEVVAPSSVLATECDVYAPCAMGGVIGAADVPHLRCAIVAGAANNPLRDRHGDADRLAAHGIRYAPDFVINGGGAIHLIGHETLGWTRAQVEQAVRGIGDTLREVYARADADGVSTEEAAERLAAARLAGG